MVDDLWALLPTSKATWLLVITAVMTLAFALAAFVLDRLRIPTKSARDSERSRSPVPNEAGQGFR
jgi:hypothetical protein